MLRDMFHEFDNILNRAAILGSGTFGSYARGLAGGPPTDVKETPTSFEVVADVPGMKKEDLSISWKNRRLCISGTRPKGPENPEDENTVFHCMERFRGQFQRCFELPETAQADAKLQAAKLSDGILRIEIPKDQKPKETSGQVTIQ